MRTENGYGKEPLAYDEPVDAIGLISYGMSAVSAATAVTAAFYGYNDIAAGGVGVAVANAVIGNELRNDSIEDTVRRILSPQDKR